MTLDQSKRADQIVEAEKARRPRWRSAMRRAPSWFCGEELDLLEPFESVKLYQELRSRSQAAQWFPMVIALANLSNAVHGLQSEKSRPLWAAIAVGFALVTLGAWLYRRQSILSAARRHIRESADWPLRFQSRTPESPV
jgi:hypothetical protein